MATLSTQQKLDEAEAEYHKLLTGTKARVFVDQNGERVEFTSANRASLRQYIEQLRMEIRGKAHPGPLRLYF